MDMVVFHLGGEEIRNIYVYSRKLRKTMSRHKNKWGRDCKSWRGCSDMGFSVRGKGYRETAQLSLYSLFCVGPLSLLFAFLLSRIQLKT